MTDTALALISLLKLINLIISSANVILAFSLLAYLITHNYRSAVARSFSALLAFITVVYAGDVILVNIDSFESARLWLHFQWIGIALVPAAYFHFSDSLLRTTNARSRIRRLLVLGAYVVGIVFFLLAVFTDLVVQDGVYQPWATHFTAGPLFWLFAVYFFVTSLGGFVNVQRARARCLTSTSRRRMTYLSVSFAAPLSVFPYLLIAGMSVYFSPHPLFFLTLAALGNVAIALMTVVMAYAVAYHGVLLPDRVVKHSLIHYLLRGPFVGVCLLVLMLVIPRVERILGLPRDAVLIFAVVVGIVVLQIVINLAKPFIDLIIYRRDREEITWFQELDKRLLTSTDLSELLEDILATLSDLLRTRSGFVIVMKEGKLDLAAWCGSRLLAERFLTSCDLTALLTPSSSAGDAHLTFNLEHSTLDEISESSDLIVQNGYWLFPLRSEAQGATLGILGVKARATGMELTPREKEWVRLLVVQAQMALENMQLQQGVFSVLQRIAPEIERIQRWRGTFGYAGPAPIEPLEESPIYSPDFQKAVKDALDHYWGGPKLSDSPLLKLGVVRDAVARDGQNPVKALRAVLDEAIESLRPDGTPSLDTREWVLYNILDMRFIQGRQIREIADRLVVSESDFYRKQRLAIEAVARELIQMEQKREVA